MEKEVEMVGTRVLIDMYLENPYEMNETENGFKLSNGEFDNPDSGDRDTKNPGILCGKIMSCGKDCRYAKEGRDIYIPATQVRPIVIADHTYFIAFEENILFSFVEK